LNQVEDKIGLIA